MMILYFCGMFFSDAGTVGANVSASISRMLSASLMNRCANLAANHPIRRLDDLQLMLGDEFPPPLQLALLACCVPRQAVAAWPALDHDPYPLCSPVTLFAPLPVLICPYQSALEPADGPVHLLELARESVDRVKLRSSMRPPKRA